MRKTQRARERGRSEDLTALAIGDRDAGDGAERLRVAI